MKFYYSILQEEAEELVQYINRKTIKYEKINMIILTILGFALLIYYAMHPDAVFAFFLVCIVAATSFLLLYIPPSRRKKLVRFLAKSGNYYSVELTKDHIIAGDPEEKIRLVEHTVVITKLETSIIIQIEKMYFGLPIRILSEEQQDEIMNLANKMK